jgi:NH3-dependent NAD+ synthetase
MIIFKDLFSGDEMFSDTYPIERLHDGAVLKVKGKHVTQSLGVDDALLGANPSAEGGDEGQVDEASVSGIDVILAHRLVETAFDKKSYQTYIKEYMKSVKASLEENKTAEVPKFMKGAAAFMKESVMPEFKEFQFYLGETMNPEGQVCLVKWEDDGNPYLFFFSHGLIEEKV